MKFVALISGGKDSIYSIKKCQDDGHELVCLANLKPKGFNEELNSYMYQSVGAEIIEAQAECIGKPLIRDFIEGKPLTLDLGYNVTENDEVEDLYRLLGRVKEQFPEVQAVSSGAIFSTYQKNRVEDVCQRLNLVSLAPLWQRDQISLLTQMVNDNIGAVLVRVCSDGLKRNHLGKYLAELMEYLVGLQTHSGNSCCGEGGEFETIVLDCPIFKKRIEVDESEILTEKENPVEYVGRLSFKKFHLVDKL